MGSKRALADRLGVSESQLSQWIHGHVNSTTGKPLGMRLSTCHIIEQKTGMPKGWMDTLHTTEPPAAYCAPPAGTHADLGRALEIIGIAIAATPEHQRQELADDMRQWALYGGREKHRLAVADSLIPKPDPRKLASA